MEKRMQNQKKMIDTLTHKMEPILKRKTRIEEEIREYKGLMSNELDELEAIDVRHLRAYALKIVDLEDEHRSVCIMCEAYEKKKKEFLV
jgi:hypothetical protein